MIYNPKIYIDKSPVHGWGVFANENIKGYIKRFPLEDKKLLTVGSSADTVINASLYGCKDITLYDICPYVKYYYDLKIASLLSLNYNQTRTIPISQISIVYVLRKLIAEKKINNSDVMIEIDNQEYPLLPSGRFLNYPISNDLFDQALNSILAYSTNK